MFDVIIIGGGPAGISTALYTTRANLKTLVFNHGKTQMANSKIENYYGFGEIEGNDLFKQGLVSAEKVGATVLFEEIVAISQEGNEFIVKSKDNTYETKAIVIAIGSKKRKPRIANLEKFEGSGVSYCAVCDGFFFRSKTVGVLGSGDFARHEAQYLSSLASVIIFSEGEQLDTEYPLYTSKVKSLEGGERLEKIILDSGEEVSLDALFIALGSAGVNDFASQLALETKNNFFVVGDDMQSNIPGIFAAGDCTGGLAQIAKAVGEGAIAGTSVIKYIRSINKKT